MARLSRLVIPQQLHHIIQRGNHHQGIFQDAEDYAAFLQWLRDAAKAFQVAIHTYVLMPDHLHLLATPMDEGGIAKMMQWVGRHYVPYFNRKYQRSGSLWQGRYRATVLEAEQYFLKCSLAIESNPVRAKLVGDAQEYPWSSFQHHIGLKIDPLITDHAVYWQLGNTPFQREAAYKEMMQKPLPNADVVSMMDAALKGWLIGSAAFKAEMVRLTERRVTPMKRGRPRKAVEKPG
ncbi:transposase [Undibacterium sp. Jales W-56]|uniref:transposase n=1 Tax=Undibacterium sp. Jales W-56 TaxID=2897325 RepID=UPI0021D2FB5D|nr:transposase [Undibacterium sp. Jales W-56]MCU6435086.1 transposase [Undibacterium sp. Jales W-56]